MANRVYELEKGWSFDGYYIEHWLELNWYFGENPFNYTGIQKIRVHGLSKGRCRLQVSTNGMQTDYISDYSAAQYIDLPNTPVYTTADFVPVTNYAEAANRGVSIQIKFEGRPVNTLSPEPPHVIQVLMIQTTAPDTGKRAN